MKKCNYCASSAFDDARVCFSCGQEFEAVEIAGSIPGETSFDDDIVEPRSSLMLQGGSARFHVAIANLFAYDIYMHKSEGSELRVGCASDNNIVLPHIHSRRHPLRIFYSQQDIWVEDKKSRQQAKLDGATFFGTRKLRKGTTLTLGEATIELIEA